MIDLIQDYLTDWKKKADILKELRDRGLIRKNDKKETVFRKFRRSAAEFNEHFERGETEMFLAHSNQKGYKITSDPSEIAKSLLDDRKRAIKLMKRYYRGMRELADKNQLTLLPGDQKLYDVISKLGA